MGCTVASTPKTHFQKKIPLKEGKIYTRTTQLITKPPPGQQGSQDTASLRITHDAPAARVSRGMATSPRGGSPALRGRPLHVLGARVARLPGSSSQCAFQGSQEPLKGFAFSNKQ